MVGGERAIRRVLIGLIVGLVGGAVTAGTALAKPLVRMRPTWTDVAQVGQVVADQRYVFMSSPSGFGGGRLLDEQTGKSVHVAPPSQDCQADVIGGGWLAFDCWNSAPSSVALYRISTQRWRSMPQPASARQLWAIGRAWVEFCTAQPPYQFIFMNISTGQDRTLTQWLPGSSTIPDLDSPGLARDLCRPLRVPNDGYYTGETDGPGSVSFLGSLVVAQGGGSSGFDGSAYIERCGSRRKWSPWEIQGSGGVVGNRNALTSGIERPGTSAPTGVFLPSRDGFSIDVSPVTSRYDAQFSEPDYFQLFLTARRMYLLAGIAPPNACGNHPVSCPTTPPQLYSAPAPREAPVKTG
jgi:hypothetical protein